MKSSLKDLLDRTIIFQFDLPHDQIEKTKISTFKDKCFKTSSNSDTSMLIYNGIVDYALGEHHVDFNNLEEEQVRAIAHHMRYEEEDDDVNKEKYGFYGEVVLNLMIQKIIGSRQLIAKGYFYNPIDRQEAHGFDAYHFYHNPNNNVTSIVFGEAKFYSNQSSAVKSAIESASKSLNVEYLNRNFYAIYNFRDKLELMPDNIASIFKKIDENPKLNVYQVLLDNNIKIVYPILIMCNQTQSNYRDKIISLVESVNKYLDKIKPIIGINVFIFFIFIPVDNTKMIKQEVIRWISERKPLV